MIPPSIETICIETGFSKRYGSGSGNCKPGKISDAEEIYRGKRVGRFLIVLDVFSDRINHLMNIVKHRDSGKIVFLLKPCLSRRYFKRFLKNPIDSVTGVEYSIGFYIDSFSDNAHEAQRSYLKLRFDDYLKIFTLKSPRTLGLIIVKALRMLKFLIVGISGYLINVASAHALMSLFIRALGRASASLIIALLSIEISISWNYMLHEKWTFRDLPRLKSMSAYLKRWLEYHFVSIGSIFAQIACVYVFTGIMNKPLILSITMGVFLGFFLNYLLSKKLVWGSSFEYK